MPVIVVVVMVAVVAGMAVIVAAAQAGAGDHQCGDEQNVFTHGIPLMVWDREGDASRLNER